MKITNFDHFTVEQYAQRCGKLAVEKGIKPEEYVEFLKKVFAGDGRSQSFINNMPDKKFLVDMEHEISRIQGSAKDMLNEAQKSGIDVPDNYDRGPYSLPL